MATKEQKLATFNIYWKKDENKIKIAARQSVYRALQSGRLIKPDKCAECREKVQEGSDGRKLIYAVHEDYSKPLEVVWLCTRCSGALRRRKD